MAWKQSDLDSIDEAIKSGELLVDFGDRKIRYRNFNELREIRAYIKGQIDSEAGTADTNAFPMGIHRTLTDKGL